MTKARPILYTTFCVLCLLAVTGPGYWLFAAGPELTPLGVPVSLMWTVGWVLASFAALLLFHLTRPRT